MNEKYFFLVVAITVGRYTYAQQQLLLVFVRVEKKIAYHSPWVISKRSLITTYSVVWKCVPVICNVAFVYYTCCPHYPCVIILSSIFTRFFPP